MSRPTEHHIFHNANAGGCQRVDKVGIITGIGTMGIMLNGMEREGVRDTMRPRFPDSLSISTFSASCPPSLSTSMPGRSLFSYWLSLSTTTSQQQPLDLIGLVPFNSVGSIADEQGSINNAFSASTPFSELAHHRFPQQPQHPPWQQQQQHPSSNSNMPIGSIHAKTNHPQKQRQESEIDGPFSTHHMENKKSSTIRCRWVLS